MDAALILNCKTQMDERRSCIFHPTAQPFISRWVWVLLPPPSSNVEGGVGSQGGSIVPCGCLERGSKKGKMKAGTACLEQGFHTHLLDVGNLLSDARGDLPEVSIARCWALAEILPTEHQQIIEDLRKKEDDVRGSGDKGNDDASSGVAANHLKEWIEKANFYLSTADPETCAVFSDLGDMLDKFDVKNGTGVSEAAMKAAVDCLYLETRQDVSHVVELDRKEEMLRNIESNIGYCSDDGLASTSEDIKRRHETPHELSMMFDSLHEHAMAEGSPNEYDLLRRLREELIPGSVE